MHPLLPVFLAATLLVLACGCTAPATITDADPSTGACWTFVVVGDSRAATAVTLTGVSPDLPAIASAIAAERPALVIFTGDLIIGSTVLDHTPLHEHYDAQFEHWGGAMRAVHDYVNGTGVPVYVVRGNHEDGNEAVLEAYLASVAQGMPADGPPGEVCLTYSFSYGGARFIGLDEYVAHDGKKQTVDQTWLDAQLNATTEPLRFVFGHAPAYGVGGEEGDLSNHPDERDRFWTSLRNHCVTAYFCGHEHLYSRGEAGGVTQLVVGTGGAPPNAYDPAKVDPAINVSYPANASPAWPVPLGYLVIRVDPGRGTISGTERVVDPATGRVMDGDTFELPARRCGG
jgi:hypothetical protein